MPKTNFIDIPAAGMGYGDASCRNPESTIQTANVHAEHAWIVAKLRDLLSRYVIEGRSTSGQPRKNHGDANWKQLWWLQEHPFAE